MGRGTIEEVLARSINPRGGPGLVEGPSKRSRTGRWILGEVLDESGDPRGGPDGSGDPR